MVNNASGNAGSMTFHTYNGGADIPERMRIDSSGNVGIGVTNPSSYWANANNLVVGGLGAVSGITIATDGNLTGSLIFADSTAAADNTRGGLQYNHSNDSMLFRVDNDTKMTILSGGNVGIGTTSPSAKLNVAGGMIAGTNNTEDGQVELYGDIRRPQAVHYTERIIYKSPGSSTVAYTIARVWIDHANWGAGLINLIIWSVYPYVSAFGKADFSCRYGYGGGTADVVTNFNPNSGTIATPTWTSATQVSGNIYYRDLQVTVPAYHQFVIKIINPGALTQTYNVNQTTQNRVYFYS